MRVVDITFFLLFLSACGEAALRVPVESEVSSFEETEFYNLALEQIEEDSLVELRREDGDRVMEGYLRYPSFEALLALYESKGEKEYIELCFRMAEAFFDLGEDLNGDGFLDWFSPKASPSYLHHFEIRASVGPSMLVALVFQEESLEEYRDRAEVLLRKIEFHIWKKWEGFMRRHTVTHMIARAGTLSLFLYEATKQNKYKAMAELIATRLKAGFDYSNGALHWRCRIGSSCGYATDSVDVSHASDTVHFILEAAERGVVFGEREVLALVKTVKEVIWNGERFSRFINGEDAEYRAEYAGQVQVFWVRLAERDEELLEIYQSWARVEESLSGVSSRTKAAIFSQIHLILTKKER